MPPTPAPSCPADLAATPPVALYDVHRTHGRGEAAVHALAGVTLECPAHQWTAVMGPSGSGKSTLLHCAAGLEPPTAGQVVLAGQDITHAREQHLTPLRRRHTGFVFQSLNLMTALTAEQNVALPSRLAGRPLPQREVHSLLASVGLADRRRHKPRELSGGQQQRVALARALSTRPAVLFADEPTGALDTTSARQVLLLLRDMVDRTGQSVLMVTHDPAAASYADRVVFLRDGRIAEETTRRSPEQIAARLAALEG